VLESHGFLGISGGKSFLNSFSADAVAGAPLSIFTVFHPVVDNLCVNFLGFVDAIGSELLADLVGTTFLSGKHEVGGDLLPVVGDKGFSFVDLSSSFMELVFDVINKVKLHHHFEVILLF